MKEIDIVFRTMFAELEQRSLDTAFTSDFPSRGWFVTVPVKGRDYMYFETEQDGATQRSYVGRKDDPEVSRRVAEFRTSKDDRKSRRKIVSTLTRQGRMGAPERFTGDVVAALGKAGLFRLRGVLVGAVAYQNYAGPLGVRLASTAMRTGDADFARSHSVSAAAGDSIPSILDVIRAVDPTFREVPHRSDGRQAAAFENAARFRVEFLTPDRENVYDEGHPAPMPALSSASARPVCFLDFLIREPIRSVLLHQSGIPISIPAPERYAVHKLIVASRRRTDGDGVARCTEDVMQARNIMEALVLTRRQADLAAAFSEARGNGPHWREALKVGLSCLGKDQADPLRAALRQGFETIGEDADVDDLFNVCGSTSPTASTIR